VKPANWTACTVAYGVVSWVAEVYGLSHNVPSAYELSLNMVSTYGVSVWCSVIPECTTRSGWQSKRLDNDGNGIAHKPVLFEYAEQVLCIKYLMCHSIHVLVNVTQMIDMINDNTGHRTYSSGTL
jgi:hypothetical protein